MTRRHARSNSDDIAVVEELMHDLETRLRRLNTKAKSEASGASNEIGDFVSDALATLSTRLRNSTQNAAHTITDEATQVGADAIEVGTNAMKKVWDEMEHRPLTTLAVAAGVGYLLGLAGRRD